MLVGLPGQVTGSLRALQGLLARNGAVSHPAVLRVLGRLERLFRRACQGDTLRCLECHTPPLNFRGMQPLQSIHQSRPLQEEEMAVAFQAG